MDDLQQMTMNSSEDFHRNENGWQNSVIIIPALLSGSTLIVIAIILWKSIRRKRRDKRKRAKDKTNDFPLDWAVNAAGVYENSLETLDPVVEKKQLPIEWSVERREVLCDGHFGPISRAVLCCSEKTQDGQHVILKELSEHCSPGEVQDFIDLLKFYVQVCNHDNLVKMLWCQTERRPPSVIMEAMSYGDLLTFLRNSRQGVQAADGASPRITERNVYAISSQVASGLEYLSEMHNLVHGYVAACNVLIHEDLSVQLCGLGLAAIQYRTGSVPARRAAQVPLKWQSPERLKGSDITEKSDVWSFGILLYEMMTLGSPPYPDVDPSQLPSKLQKNYRMEQPPQCGPRLYEVMSSCWQWEALLRPCFTDVVKQLQNATEQADGLTPVTAGDTLSWSEYLRVAGIPS
ncbi:tyrosine-protein kinase STYK1-like [Hyla sarda]|uniref:tyrosine-protein kinase STYK1-like n=1 Tax=Hyla sarda TaxID=327740 RepID=UPI0024C39D7B|nr:tyrosine-protein kinase STYK1-like [Hyla sarda]XP_056400192.1 tyrosine-protein kinase STYK1-like [Hyla sarda]XP_056400193.1 tyrosine-protein kinase STYK1-like [Hyla sarda]XP_056400194.1 tyrosine-protein kinase STYK1-like [Hyla sarda]XP_056400195.1 tyrosine-protein kinase STYK1-like [Hyla sarda]XP_056400196.1 tyrosine-protein kinase STYK1-like [Hyla sarda]XP_056400197.1 tyrosine-protein kinase STYK1-like [Hyla sarda]